MLTRDSILSVADLARREVDVPEWGGSVFVRTMNGRELWAFQRKFAGKPADVEEVLTAIVLATCCDDSGSLLFTEADADALKAKNPAAVSRVASVAFEMNQSLTAEGQSRAEKN